MKKKTERTRRHALEEDAKEKEEEEPIIHTKTTKTKSLEFSFLLLTPEKGVRMPLFFLFLSLLSFCASYRSNRKRSQPPSSAIKKKKKNSSRCIRATNST